MKEQLEQIRKEALQRISNLSDIGELEKIRVDVLGKKGSITQILKGLGSLSSEERPLMGKVANEVRSHVEEAITKKVKELNDLALKEKLSHDIIDITLEGKELDVGHAHPLYKTIGELTDVLVSMGFSIAEGPEIELVRYNFDALNVPKDHPSRDLGDTFYIGEDVCLRTQTSPVQVREMEGKTPPIKIISPGKVYRRDEIDATHSPLFHQLEGLVVDKHITMADLKGTLDYVAKRLYGSATKTRLRPHQFYFTEPSAEMDATCFVCGGKGCRVCKQSGWIEILGCGMVHPNVLRACGIDPEVYSGFAFGMGVDRMTMLKYGIPDLRMLFGSDTQFLGQF